MWMWDESEASKDSTSQFSARAKKYAKTFPAKPDSDVGDVDKAFANASAMPARSSRPITNIPSPRTPTWSRRTPPPLA